MNNDKPILLEIDNVRIVRNDPMNLIVERLETNYNKIQKKDITKHQLKGYYSTIQGALRGILHNELLVDENDVKDLKRHLEQVKQVDEKILKALNGAVEL